MRTETPTLTCALATPDNASTPARSKNARNSTLRISHLTHTFDKKRPHGKTCCRWAPTRRLHVFSDFNPLPSEKLLARERMRLKAQLSPHKLWMSVYRS